MNNWYIKGQSLIEVVVALAVGAAVVAAIASSVLSSLSSTQFSKNQSLATSYAQQGMEIVRRLRNSSFASFSELGGSYCLGKDSTNLGSSVTQDCLQNVDVFVREVDVQQYSCTCGSSRNSNPQKNVRKVAVSVAWSDSKCVSLPTPTPTGILKVKEVEIAGADCEDSVSVGGKIPTSFCHRAQLVSCLSDVAP